MKSYIYIIAAALLLLLIAVVGVQSSSIHRLTDEKERFENNYQALEEDLQQYIIRDSIHVAQSRSLELTIDELQRYRAADAQLIRDLGIKNKDLEAMLSASAETIRHLEGQASDTVIVTREVRDTLKHITHSDQWLDVDIVVADNGLWRGNITHRLDLSVVLETQYKRFLGCLWRTNVIDHQDVHVAAPGDPYTQIRDVELIRIEK